MEGEEGKGGGEGGLNIYPSYYLQTGGGPTIIETIFFVFFEIAYYFRGRREVEEGTDIANDVEMISISLV